MKSGSDAPESSEVRDSAVSHAARPLNGTHGAEGRGAASAGHTRPPPATAARPRATVAEVLADGNRDARTSGCLSSAGVHTTAFCWNTDDGSDKGWYPQGLTASWDASADGRYGGHVAILASWYDHRDVAESRNKGVRISFVNYDDPARITYRHVLLVEPVSTSDFRAVVLHAGGRRLSLSENPGARLVFTVTP